VEPGGRDDGAQQGNILKLHQDSQDYGSDDQHMVSRVFFTITVGGKPVGDGNTVPFYADVKLVVGGDYEKDELEVGKPMNYRGPWNQAAFAKAVARYVRRCVGPNASGIRIEGGGSVRMRNNQFSIFDVFSFDANEVMGGTW
jgi:hypothetical protein